MDASCAPSPGSSDCSGRDDLVLTTQAANGRVRRPLHPHGLPNRLPIVSRTGSAAAIIVVSLSVVLLLSSAGAQANLIPSGGIPQSGTLGGPTAYTVTFTEKGLPTGAVWSITIGSTTNFSETSTLTFSETSGTYQYTVGEVPAYSPTSTSGNVTVSGGATGVTIAFKGLIQHVVVITMESYDLSQIISTAAPYQHYLLNTYGNATNYYSECHGSYPNYVGETSGWYAPCGSTPVPASNVSNIGDTLQAHNLTWMGYFEGMSVPCDTSNGGSYVTGHNPFLVYKDIVDDKSRCDAHIVNSAAFNQSIANGTLPTYSYYIPNDYDDCHSPLSGQPASTELPFCDAWLKAFLAPILNSTSSAVQALLAHTVIFITYDEGPGNLFYGYATGGIVNPYCLNETGNPLTVCGGHITLTTISPYSRGTRYLANATDFSELSTVEYLLDIPSDGGYDGSPYFPAMTCLFSHQCQTFTESGLPAGTSWSISITGQPTQTSTTSNIIFHLPNGTYTYQVSAVAGYATAIQSGTLSAGGLGSQIYVEFYPALTAPPAPTIDVTTMGVDQAVNVTGTISTTGVPTYSWTWLTSVGGGGYSVATQCAMDNGTGATQGASVTCFIPGGSLSVGGNYTFELQVTDSASTPEVQTSSPSTTLRITSAPSVSAVGLDRNQNLTVMDSLPRGGVPPYAWTWLVSENGATFGVASQCAVSHGTGGAAGATVTCAIAGSTLAAGKNYTFELQYNNSASPPVSQTTVASSTVTVASTLEQPGVPAVSSTELDRNRVMSVTDSITPSGTAPVFWEWLESANGGAYVPASQCAVERGTSSGKIVCSIPDAILVLGSTYTFELQVEDSAGSPEIRTSEPSANVTVNPPFLRPGAPTVSAVKLDVDQSLTVSDLVPAHDGTPPFAWQWLVSTDSAPFTSATQCEANSGTGAQGGSTIECVIPPNTLIAHDDYQFELTLTDSATHPSSGTTTASATVKVWSALTAPATPSVSAVLLDVNQALKVSGAVPSDSGTSPFAWTWLESVDGSSFSPSTQCGTNGGSGAAAGATVTCSMAKSILTAGDTYAFELEIKDDATVPESEVSLPSPTVTVHTALAAPSAPSVSATKLDVNQSLSVLATLPSTGTPSYSWVWLISVNGGAYATATPCSSDSGSGSEAGANVSCTVAAGSFTSGDEYQFEIRANDSANVSESQTSSSSLKVRVDPALSEPLTPVVSATAIHAGQTLTITAKLNSSTSGGPFPWKWLISENGGTFSPATVCSVNQGTATAGNATVVCTIPGHTLTAGDTYGFELQIADSASVPESACSPPSQTVSVT